MESLEIIRQTLSQQRERLFAQFGIRTLALFGSVARGQQTSGSDIDILVDFDRPVGVEFIDLAEHLEDLLQRRVDLVSRKAIKPTYYKRIESDLIYV